ncbi:MAG: NAD(P)-dependent oxidoreductase, partial [Hyphomicrobiales bacterium]|nr:NAD(P)-dependent oxidoreductase [Hyphomicrobiales bacterium]
MFIVDRELERIERAGTPIRVGMVGAGFMARGIARQMLKYTKGMELVAISNRHPDGARKVYGESGVSDVVQARSAAHLDECIARGQRAIVDDPTMLCDAERVDVVLEVTGAIEFAARLVMRA